MNHKITIVFLWLFYLSNNIFSMSDNLVESQVIENRFLISNLSDELLLNIFKLLVNSYIINSDNIFSFYQSVKELKNLNLVCQLFNSILNDRDIINIIDQKRVILRNYYNKFEIPIELSNKVLKEWLSFKDHKNKSVVFQIGSTKIKIWNIGGKTILKYLYRNGPRYKIGHISSNNSPNILYSNEIGIAFLLISVTIYIVNKIKYSKEAPQINQDKLDNELENNKENTNNNDKIYIKYRKVIS